MQTIQLMKDRRLMGAILYPLRGSANVLLAMVIECLSNAAEGNAGTMDRFSNGPRGMRRLYYAREALLVLS